MAAAPGTGTGGSGTGGSGTGGSGTGGSGTGGSGTGGSGTGESGRQDPVHPESPVEQTSTISFAPQPDTDTKDGELTQDDAAALEALPAGSALLLVQRGPSAGSRFLLDTDEVSAGRHPDSDIFLDDVTVSRRHAVFRRGSDGYHVVDVGSLNGTYVNRDRIDDVRLNGRDEVQIGKFRLVFFPGSAPGAAAQ